MGDVIKFTDFVDPSAETEFKAFGERIKEEFVRVEKSIQSAMDKNKEFLKSMGTPTSGGQAEQIIKTTKAVDDQSKAYDKLKQQYDKVIAAEQKMDADRRKLFEQQEKRTAKEIADNEKRTQKEIADNEKRSASERKLFEQQMKEGEKRSAEINRSNQSYQKLATAYSVAAEKAKQLAAAEILAGKSQKDFSAETKLAQAESLKMGNILKEVDAATGQHTRNVGNYVGAVQKLYSGLKTAANIIPGLGISGMILAGYEIISGLITDIVSGIHQSVEGTKEWNDATTEMLGNFHTLMDDYKKSVIEGKVLNGELSETEGKVMVTRMEAVKKIKDLQKDYNKQVATAEKIAAEEKEKQITKTAMLMGTTAGIEINIEIEKNKKIKQAGEIAASELSIIQSTLAQDIRNIRKEADNKEEEDAKKKREKLSKATLKDEEKNLDSAWKVYLKIWEMNFNELLKLQKESEKEFLKSEDKKWDKANKLGDDRTKLIIDNMRLEASLTQSKIDDENADYEERKNNFKAQYDEFGNISEESKKHMELLEKQHNQNLLHIQYDAETADDKTKKEKVKKENDHLKEVYKIVSDYQ
ncbi:hypothetical protein UFOVP1599_67, partial [uncultured Caudovirales phage]